jgi:RNA-binding protein
MQNVSPTTTNQNPAPVPLSSKQRADLRAEAHHLRAIVHVGQHGLTDAARQTIDDAIRTHELVKLQFTKSADLTVRDAANDLATALSAEVVQVIGRTATLYRENPELKRKDGVPPWRTS